MTIIRAAVPADGEGIGEAHASAWQVAYEELFPADQLADAVAVRRLMWVGLVADPALRGTLLVAEKHGRTVGFIHYGTAAENQIIGEVYGFYVHPSSWGSGIAQALMDRSVRSLAESFNRVILWTHMDAGRARRFYTKTGWIETGHHRQETTWDGMTYPAVEYERRSGSMAPGR